MESATSDNLKSLADKGLILKPDSGSVTQVTISGHDAFDVSFVGADKDKLVKINIKIVATNNAKRFFALTYWGPGAVLAANAEDLKTIVDSVQVQK